METLSVQAPTNDTAIADATARASTVLPPIRQLSHLATRTNDMEAVRKFYEDFLCLPMTVSMVADFDVVTNAKSNYLHCFFQLDDKSSIAFFQFEDGFRGDAFPRTSDGYERHLALRVDRIEDVETYKQRAIHFGVEHFIVDHDDFYSLYLLDPDGEQLEITWHKPSLEQIVSAGEAHQILEDWLKNLKH